MKRFLVKTGLVCLPIFMLLVFVFVCYSTDEGDLLRMGYVYYKGDCRKVFKKELTKPILFDTISNSKIEKKYTVLTIGDSFSEQKGFGYKNYLIESSNISVLHYDRFLHNNPIETVYGILNGNTLNNIKIDYIILESVERGFVKRGYNFNYKKRIDLDSIYQISKKHKNNVLKKENDIDKLPSRSVKFLFQNFLYFLDDNAYLSDVYKVKTTEKLFSIDANELLFFSDDIKNIKENNDLDKVSHLNDELNKLYDILKKREIKLIVLPCPDKYDFYYDYIVEKNRYPKPLFFDYFEKFPKKYIYINSKQILKSEFKDKKDMYFFDDTHWSPFSSMIIANRLKNIINRNNNKISVD
jgi:hypothetical protein